MINLKLFKGYEIIFIMFKLYFLLYFFLLINLSFCFSLSPIRLFDKKKDMNINKFGFTCSDWSGNQFNTLLFEGGGVRAVVYSGAIQRLEEENMIENIQYLAGTSSGAQTAALLCCGYNSKEMKEVLENAPWDKILNGKLLSFKGIKSIIKKFGYCDSIYLKNYLDNLLYRKTGIKNITFLELYNYSSIHLKIGVCSLKDKDFKYIDHITYPDMPVSIGLTASSSIPFIFTSVKWEEDLFIDGGLVGNLPITAFPEQNSLAFNLINNDFLNIDKKKPKNIFIFIKNILLILLRNSQKFYSSDNNCIKNVDYIQIFTGNVTVLERNFCGDTIDILINQGYNAVDHFLNR